MFQYLICTKVQASYLLNALVGVNVVQPLEAVVVKDEGHGGQGAFRRGPGQLGQLLRRQVEGVGIEVRVDVDIDVGIVFRRHGERQVGLIAGLDRKSGNIDRSSLIRLLLLLLLVLLWLLLLLLLLRLLLLLLLWRALNASSSRRHLEQKTWRTQSTEMSRRNLTTPEVDETGSRGSCCCCKGWLVVSVLELIWKLHCRKVSPGIIG